MIIQNRAGIWAVLGIVILVALCVSLFLVQYFPAPLTTIPAITPTSEGFIYVINAVSALGGWVTWVGYNSPFILGCLTLILIPLALVGIWTINNFRRIVSVYGIASFNRRLFDK